MRMPWLGGNWKMNGDLALAAAYRSRFEAFDPAVEVCAIPAFPYLQAFSGHARLRLGAQDLSAEASGAFTGEVSAGMLKEFNVEYVLVGHSERRTLYAESNALVARKFLCAYQSGLKPVLCVGESLAQREDGQTEALISAQLDAVRAQVPPEAWSNAVIAYEPIWAIGTGKTASPEQAQSVHRFIRDKLRGFDDRLMGSQRIVYGGSVKGSNAASLFSQPDIDGALVGGASLNVEEFLLIANALAQRHLG